MFKLFIKLGLPLVLILVLFIALMCCGSSGGEGGILVATNTFCSPLSANCELYENQSYYKVTSNYGYRFDPFDGFLSFHNGIDLGANEGTPIYASSNGIVYEVGYSESGLGNYIYIRHESELGVLYSAYGHMLDDSIVVEEGEIVYKGMQIGSVGSTGNSTGNHLHFMIMKEKISFQKKDLIDPTYIIYGLK